MAPVSLSEEDQHTLTLFCDEKNAKETCKLNGISLEQVKYILQSYPTRVFYDKVCCNRGTLLTPKDSNSAHIQYGPGLTHSRIASKVLVLIDPSVSSITIPPNTPTLTPGMKGTFSTPNANVVADVYVTTGDRGIIGIEVLAMHRWCDIAKLARKYRLGGFHHLVCLKVARAGNIDNMFFVHFDFIRHTAKLCCFAGIGINNNRAVDLHPVISNAQRQNLLADLGIGPGGWQSHSEIPQLMTLHPQGPPANHILRLELYGTESVEIQGTQFVPIPFDTTALDVTIDLAQLVEFLAVRVRLNEIPDWQSVARSGKI